LYGLNYCLGWTHEIGGEFLEARACYVSAVDTTYWEPDRWYGIIGVLNLDLVDSDPAKIQEFVMDINFSSHLFEGGTTWAARPFFLSAHAVDDIDLHQVKDFYLKLSKVKFADLPDIYIGKLWMMRYLLAQGLGKSMESYKAIKNSIKYLFTSHYDFAHDLHLESLHGLILDCKDRENDIIRVYDLFLEELSSSHILKKAINILSDLIDLLYAKKMYDRIVELSKKFTDKELVKTERLFQLAYCLVHIKENKRGKVIYELHLKTEGESAAALNNLGLLYVENEQYEHALGLYTRGLEIDPEHENINKNIKIAQHRFDEIKAQEITRLTLEKEFRASTAALHLENDYILEKLSQFILQIKLQEDFKEWLVPIAKHKFYTLLNIDRQRAESIREQWLKKGYLKQTDDRDQNGSIIYSINPFMEAEMLKLSKHKIPKQWIDGFISISIQSLEQVDYFSIMERIVKVNKKFRALLERDFNELTYNHLLGLQKATIVLSGSLVELALTYYFERKKFKTIPVKDSKGNIKNKKLYDCVLSDLIDFSMEKNFFGNDFSYLSNLSRIYRNFIHPGRELKDSLDKGKADLCYISTREILKKIV
ncbi:MAG: tetratricopeptide repeat protein, partial [Chitinophagaceae bacterium]